MWQFIFYQNRLAYFSRMSLNIKQKIKTRNKTTGTIHAPQPVVERRDFKCNVVPITITALKSGKAATSPILPILLIKKRKQTNQFRYCVFYLDIQ